MNIQYKFLDDTNWVEVFQANKEAFSDYLVPMILTPGNFRNHLAQNAVDLSLSVGAFSDDKLIGYTLNGFDTWNGKYTAYDAGTGVIPEFRKKGIGSKMFDFLLPKLSEMGVEQMLLEVLSNNEKAIPLYQKMGFKETRRLEFFEQTEDIPHISRADIKITKIKKPDWRKLKTFWDRDTSWQFSCNSFERNIIETCVLGAYFKEKCIGYGALFSTAGTIAQIAIDKNYRRKGAASILLMEMRKETVEDKKLRFSNVDSGLESLKAFAESMNFEKTISQIEMILEV